MVKFCHGGLFLMTLDRPMIYELRAITSLCQVQEGDVLWEHVCCHRFERIWGEAISWEDSITRGHL
jgi:hypothetical protein